MLSALLTLAAADRAPAALGSPVTAAPAGELVAPPGSPLHMPTAVAVDPTGRVFVADGVNDRVVEFDPAGALRRSLREIGEYPLRRPVTVAFDALGRLWIADTGHSRLILRSADGATARVFPLPRGEGEKPPEPTGLAVTADGRVVWTADNHHHRLIRFDVEAGVASTFGRKGESLGQLNHPFMLALAAAGAVWTTDVLNGRIARFSSAGQPLTSVSAYGVDLGALYRPKGIAVDRRGIVYVSDSVLGVVQAFTGDGLFIDVVRGGDGRPFRFSMPMGLAADAGDHLYVVELGADRVRRLRLSVQAPAPAPKAPPRPAIAGGRARSCTVCHLEWMEPLDVRRATELIAPPDASPDEPWVSRAETCLSCHDSSVVDSRRRVWQEHGHRTGVTPPPGMRVPAALPLVRGKIACRTCHSAHANAQFTGDVATAVFLRVQNTAGELCIGCHADKTRGPALGTHPTGGMPWPVPRSLIDAGAVHGANPRELTCTVCHTPHGSVEDHLLVLGTASNQLCLACHDQIRPGMFRDGEHAEHPLSPPVNAAQRQAVLRMGTKLGDGDRLICLSCHKLHHGKGERFMLADDLTDGRFCIACHAEKRTLIAASHDLRAAFPDERNRLGMTPGAGGPCSACHLFHRYARPPEISPIDPGGGKCITCHQPGRCAAGKALGPANHPGAACVECHDPHVNPKGHYLRAPAATLCAKCHEDHFALTGGPHDCTTRPADWPAAATAEADRCLACHRPHADTEARLFRVAAGGSARPPEDAACIACHPGSDWHAAGGEAAIHPRASSPAAEASGLPLVEAGAKAAVGCRTCHNPHAPRGGESRFLRVAGDQPTSTLCVNCHPDTATIESTRHGAANLAASGFETGACLPCHAVHASASAVRPALLWPESLAAPPGIHMAETACAACHRSDGGGAPVPAIATHPALEMFNPVPEDAPGFLPLFDGNGRMDPRGAISCRTCHTPHGRWPDAALAAQLATAGVTANAGVAPGTPGAPGAGRGGSLHDRMRGMRLMLRRFVPPNVCTTCHGADALRRFLYFHDPHRRGGPLLPAAPAITPPGA